MVKKSSGDGRMVEQPLVLVQRRVLSSLVPSIPVGARYKTTFTAVFYRSTLTTRLLCHRSMGLTVPCGLFRHRSMRVDACWPLFWEFFRSVRSLVDFFGSFSSVGTRFNDFWASFYRGGRFSKDSDAAKTTMNKEG